MEVDRLHINTENQIATWDCPDTVIPRFKGALKVLEYRRRSVDSVEAVEATQRLESRHGFQGHATV